MSRVVVPLNHSAVGHHTSWRTRAAISTFPSQIANFLILPALLSLLLSACAMEGDFGRPRATVLTKVTDEILLNANILTNGLTITEFSRDETIMREAGRRMARPLLFETYPTDISYGAKPAGYVSGRWTHPSESPLAPIARELNSDHHVLTQFGQAARRVLAADSQSMLTVLKHDPGLRIKAKHEVRARMQENFDFIESVFEDFSKRLQAYHYAIEDLRAQAPDVVVSEARGSLQHLSDRTASLEYELTQYYGAALARSDSRPPRFASREYPGRGPRLPYGPAPDGGIYDGGRAEGPTALSFK